MNGAGVDVLIVGARCAGASLAIRLARAGKRVIAVDRDDFPSDQPLSTHLIGAHGVEMLEELGLGEELRSIASPIRMFSNGIEGAQPWIELPRPVFSPRRMELDAMLVAAARAAGADVRPRTKLVELIREGERVVGGVVEHGGVREEIRASVVVGADGPHSTVAKLAKAATYKEYESPRAGYWGYWPRPAWYENDRRYRGAAIIQHRNEDYRLAFPSGKDQLLLGIIFPMGDLPAWRGRHRETYLERVKKDPLLGPLAEGAEPVGKLHGLVTAQFFFRQSAGPGWALVGDAGLFKDPAPGLGITDALRDSKAIARAIEEGTDEALVAYWRERDVKSLELFHFAKDLGMPGYNNPMNRMVYRRIAGSSALQARVVAVAERRVAPSAAFRTRDVVRWTLREVLRGRFDVIPPFLATGKRNAAIAKELAEWTARAEAARTAAAEASKRPISTASA